MERRVGWEFWAEVFTGGACGALAGLTLVSRDWIEATFGVDPDHGNGGAEWLIVGVLALVAVTLGLRARALWRVASQPTR